MRKSKLPAVHYALGSNVEVKRPVTGRLTQHFCFVGRSHEKRRYFPNPYYLLGIRKRLTKFPDVLTLKSNLTHDI